MIQTQSLKKLFFPKKEEKVLDALFRSSFINVIARGFGYLKNVAIAVLFGFNFQTDAFFMALSLMGIFLIFADVFNSIGVPQLVIAKLQNQEEFKNLAGLLLTLTVILTLGITLLSVIAYPIVSLIPVGFDKTSLHYMGRVYFLLLPYLALNFVFHYCGAVLRSIRRFTQYFIGELIFSFFSFLFTLLGLYYFHNYKALPLALSLAQILSTVYIIIISKEFFSFKFFMNDTTKQILRHFGYLCLLYGTFYLFLVVDKSFASLLPEKSISALTYGYMIAYIPLSIIRLDQITITSLSEERGSIKKLNFYLKKIILISIPILVFYLLFAGILIKLLFFYGHFTNTDFNLTKMATTVYAFGIPFWFMWPLIYRVFQIRDKLLPVFLIALIGIICNFLLNYIFVLKLQLGIIGIACGTVFASMMIAMSGYLYLKFKQYT